MKSNVFLKDDKKMKILSFGKSRKFEIDMTTGAVLPKLLTFCIPLILSSILQLLYNAADIIVVGRFAGKTALAAVGSTGSLINLIVNLFLGLSIGTSVVVAHEYGAADAKSVSKTVHTSIAVSIVAGIAVGIFGFFTARQLLELMGSPTDVIDQAALYVKIYFIGMPASMIYNFGAAVLRAIGDTKRPLIFLSISGVINIIFNLVFVIVFNLDVAGVAISTVISQIVSAVFIVICLMKSDGAIKLYLKELRIYSDKLFKIMRVGLPAGLQGCIFSLSNVLIQSGINSFGSTIIAGNSAAQNIEGFVYAAMNAVYQGALTFTGQNIGSKKYNRINRILFTSLGTVTVIGIVLGFAAFLAGDFLIAIYYPEADVIAMGKIRLGIICTTYFLCGIMDVFVGMLRGMGSSVLPMLVSLTGACGLRIVWIFTVFQVYPTTKILYLSYPVSWLITALVHAVCYLIIKRKFSVKSLEAA